MTETLLKFRRAWMLVPLAAVGLLAWSTLVRIQHISYVSAITPQAPVIDQDSATGYAFRLRDQIPPDQNIESFQWIEQTQQMAAEETLRLRHSETDNAPYGRTVQSPSATRWWLGLLARVDHLFSGRPFGLCVERAALYADPLLHLLLLLTATLFIAVQFGALPAALVSMGFVSLFPFAGSFQPGIPTSHGLSFICAFWSVVLLASGLHARMAGAPADDGDQPTGPVKRVKRARRYFVGAGIALGLGLWIDASGQFFLTAGIVIGAALVTWMGRKRPEATAQADATPIPWLWWALSAALTCCTAWLLEQFPDRMTWLPGTGIHPVHALGLLGVGELLQRADDRTRRGQWFQKRGQIVLTVLAGLFLAGAIFAVMRQGNLAGNLLDWRLTNLPASPVAPNLMSWLAHDGFSGAVWAVLIPLIIFVPAFWMLFPEKVTDGRHLEIALLLGPALLMAGLACFQLRAWSLLDAVLLALLVVMTAPLRVSVVVHSPRRILFWSALAGIIFVPGMPLLISSIPASRSDDLTAIEARSLMERDLAHWLGRRAGPDGAVVFAPPKLTSSLIHWGGIRGIGTMVPDNADGTAAAIRIASSTSDTETLALLEKREITHIIIPSWDPVLDDFARIGSGNPNGTFMAVLHRWEVKPWLRPVVYPIPQINEWDRSSVAIFEVVGEQAEADAVSRQAEYFLEMGELERAASYRTQLENYPSSLGALAALAQIEMARGDTVALARILELVVPYTVGGAARSMPWDRRVSLAIVLTQARERELAKEQIRRCLDQINLKHLLSLTPGSLYRFLLLGRRFDLPITDPVLRERALEELPPDLRKRLLAN